LIAQSIAWIYARIYNIAEPNSYVSTAKARSELGFEASYRLGSSPNDATRSAAISYNREDSLI
jgi:hypothetical protein